MQPVLKEQIETPALLIDLDILERNIQIMAEFMKNKNAKLRPHFKTHKCPTIAHKQISKGAKGITCAKLGEAEILAAAGIKDILIANEIVEPSKVFRLAGIAHSDAKITVAVDNAENIADLSRAASIIGSTIYVLVEVDIGMRRCGVTTPNEVVHLVKKIINSEGLVFEGLQAYEGHLVYKTDFNERYHEVQEIADKLGEIRAVLTQNGVSVNEISGGGTGTYNITGNNTIWTEIQAGSYVFMDTVYNKLGLDFQDSLTILATVIHKHSGYAITDAGFKVCSVEQGQPQIKDYPDLRIEELNEEHGKIIDEKNELQYRQKIEYVPSHCCGTVNLYDKYYCVRNGLLETVWPVSARGKSQ